MAKIEDELWIHFKPLWRDLTTVSGEIIVAGGYGLFLKQQWLLDQDQPVIVVPLERWPDPTPRVTKDFDLVVGLDLIADETTNSLISKALKDNGFEVSTMAQGKRWQFFKRLSEDRQIIVELHAPTPPTGAENLRTDRIRVKHAPSLGEEGVHGRHNPEAVGSQMHPFKLSIDDLDLEVLNPVTWSVMKLTAAADRWLESLNLEKSSEIRALSRIQAVKHAHDACRAVAMMTIDERDNTVSIIAAIKDTDQFLRASEIYREIFTSPDAWAQEVLTEKWLAEDLATIVTVLGSWFGN